jgi:hypothetical protein
VAAHVFKLFLSFHKRIFLSGKTKDWHKKKQAFEPKAQENTHIFFFILSFFSFLTCFSGVSQDFLVYRAMVLQILLSPTNKVETWTTLL